jgi:hypothetical protein
MTDTQTRRYPDTIETSEGKLVRLSDLRPDQTIRIGKHHTAIKVKNIPITVALLSCGDVVRGIAFNEGNVVFCETCHENKFVAELLGA